MVGESLENFSLEGVQQQGETVKKAWVGWHKSEVANIHQSESFFLQYNEIKGEEVIRGLGNSCISIRMHKQPFRME